MEEPRRDFDVNLLGTLNLLEELRRLPEPPPLLFTSTNKVYGSLADVAVRREGDQWRPHDARLRRHGVDESRALAFCTPYGCSKGGADQYVLDYAKTYGMPATVFRMSCIYGRHQHGNEDQGWVAHFLVSLLAGRPLTIYGDGAQVRDVLHADDLVDAMLGARAPTRAGDQAWYVSDAREAARTLGWKPSIDSGEGIASLYEWLGRNRLRQPSVSL
jgi:CDP-paratose 2-epimerase